jgi:hypothetical protein
MSMIYDSRAQLFAVDGIATETTVATFVSAASNKEVRLFQEDGQAAAGAGDTFFITYKDGSGICHTSPKIVPSNIISYKKTAAVTAVPAYSYFGVDVTGMAINDLFNVFVRIYGLGTGSSADQYEKTVMTTVATGDTSATLAAKIGIQLYKNFASEYKIAGRGTTVYNKAGYSKIYATEAAVVADKAALTDTHLIWVIANAKPYTVADKTALTFATICTEKTNWATEIAANTAVVVPAVKYYDFVQLSGTTHRIYICAKTVAQDDERFSGTSSITNVSAVWYDASAGYAKTEAAVTHVFEVINPGSGKRLRNKEVSLDFNHRPYGRFEIMGEAPQLNIVTTTSYTLVDIVFKTEDLNTNNANVKTKGYFQVTVAFATAAHADTFIASLDAVVKGDVVTSGELAALTLGDLADVDFTTPPENGEVIKYDGTDEVWVPAADAT